MSTKKFVNKANDATVESMAGFCAVYPHLDCHRSKRLLLAPNWHEKDGKVALISGGGSGHEPFPGGYVGTGMLTAGICGDVFAAAPTNNILHALNCVAYNSHAGVLALIPNYTGDLLNFGLAIEEAKQAGHTVEAVIVADDCSIPIEDQGRVGKRCLVGILFVIKIAGALANQRKSLSEVAQTAQIVADSIATYGVGLNPCSLPGQERMFEIPKDEIEFGLGMHGEAGVKRAKWATAAEIVHFMLERIVTNLELKAGYEVAVIVNNFGATTQLEQGIVVHEVVKQLKTKKIEVARVYCGILVSSLDSAGIHVSILRLSGKYRNLLIQCLDEPTDAPCWPGRAYSLPWTQKRPRVPEPSHKVACTVGPELNDHQAELVKRCLVNACEQIIEKEENINSLDRGCGDGDCGSTYKKLANGILASLDDLIISHPVAMLTQLAWIAEEHMGGTSGAVYSLMFRAAATELEKSKVEGGWSRVWAKAWHEGIAGIAKYSKAMPGDRTMLDTLIPACKALEETATHPIAEATAKVVEAAWSGCAATKFMQPMCGRASYVKQAELLSAVDAGSFGSATWIEAIANTVANWE